jgi:hypothetical protein
LELLVSPSDQDITMLDTLEIWSSMSYKSSQTWSSRPVRTQPTTLNGNADISFIWCSNKAFFDVLERRQWKLSFSLDPSSRRFVDHSMWPQYDAALSILSQVGLVPCQALSPGWGRPHLVVLNPRTSLLQYKLSSSRYIRVWVLFSASFPLRNSHLHCNCDVKSFCYESGPPFLFSTIVVISPFAIRAWTPYLSLLHTHLQFQIVCLYFLSCVLRFAWRISLLGEVNQIVLGW